MIETVETSRRVEEVDRALEDGAAEFGLSVLNAHDLAHLSLMDHAAHG